MTPDATVLGWEAWYTLGALVVMTAGLGANVARPDLVLLGTLGLLLLAGVVSPADAFYGLSNPAVVTVGALFVVAAGVERTRALAFLDRLLSARSRGKAGGILARVMPMTSVLSGFLNNTPVVAMLIPRLEEWGRQRGVPASKLLIPLSYAAILGGMLTLVGASTNVVVHGLLLAEGLPGFNMFDFAWIGVPAVAIVATYFVLIGHRTLPATGGGEGRRAQLRDYHFDVRVSGGAPFAGRTIEEAELRTLGGAYLAHLRRGDRIIAASPEEVLEAGDVLTFVGDAGVLDELLKRPGLERKVSAVETQDRLRDPHDLTLYEAVISTASVLVGRTLKETGFRERYRGVVLAIHRRDERISGSLGQTPLKAGDLLLIEGGPYFDHYDAPGREEFYYVAPVQQRVEKASRRAPIALGILLGMVAVATTGIVPLTVAAFSAALGMVVVGCVTGPGARQAIDLSVLLVIAGALGIGKAVESTGLAAAAAQFVTGVAAGSGPLVALVLIYVTANVLSELITNKASAVLVFPVALSVALEIGADPKAFALAVTIGAAASFLTPIGYQTNLMVMGPGGYRYTDYAKAGFPVSLTVATIAISIINLIWL
ncbi:MAG: SLC13 family permease [Bacteroidota bacterium]